MSHIMVVDDSEDIRMLYRRALESAGYVIQEASSGGTALDLMRSAEHIPALVILDLQMPEMDGSDVLALMRSRDDLSSVRVLVCTASADVAAKGELPCDGILVKPFHLNELVDAVSSLIG